MPSLSGLICGICDHVLRLVPDPAEAKRLDDIVDPDDDLDAGLALAVERGEQTTPRPEPPPLEAEAAANRAAS